MLVVAHSFPFNIVQNMQDLPAGYHGDFARLVQLLDGLTTQQFEVHLVLTGQDDKKLAERQTPWQGVTFYNASRLKELLSSEENDYEAVIIHQTFKSTFQPHATPSTPFPNCVALFL